MSDRERPRELPSPPPLSEQEATLDASIRVKLDLGKPLSPEERAFLARLPGRREYSAARARELYGVDSARPEGD